MELVKRFAIYASESVHFAGPIRNQKEKNCIFSGRDNIFTHELRPYRSEFIAELLIKTNFDIVTFDRFYSEEAYSFQVRKHVPLVMRVIVMQDFHSLHLGRQK